MLRQIGVSFSQVQRLAIIRELVRLASKGYTKKEIILAIEDYCNNTKKAFSNYLRQIGIKEWNEGGRGFVKRTIRHRDAEKYLRVVASMKLIEARGDLLLPTVYGDVIIALRSNNNENPYALIPKERFFFTKFLLMRDIDQLGIIISLLRKQVMDKEEMAKHFKNMFIEVISKRLKVCESPFQREKLQKILYDVYRWPERWSDSPIRHRVESRFGWLADLGLARYERENGKGRGRYVLVLNSDFDYLFQDIEKIPFMNLDKSRFDYFIHHDFHYKYTKLFFKNVTLRWKDLSPEKIRDNLKSLLSECLSKFGTVGTISAISAIEYICCALASKGILASFYDIMDSLQKIGEILGPNYRFFWSEYRGDGFIKIC